MKEIKLPMKKSFLEFMSLCEASLIGSPSKYDRDVAARGFQMSGSARPGGEGRMSPKRTKDSQGNIKSTAKQQKRMKAAGGGKMVPAKKYKLRKDAGKPNPRRSPAGREQQPTQERGSAKLDPREAQRKAAMERRAAKSGAKPKTADELLAKKAKAKVDPNYKPAKASGMTRAERMSVTRKGETKLRNIMKGQETEKYKKATGQDPDKKGKMKIMGRVHQRMSN